MNCCPQNPIMLDGELAFICEHHMPRLLKFEDGIIVRRNGERVMFFDLRTVGHVHTQRFGMLTCYTTATPPKP